MHNIYIVLTQTGTLFSKSIKLFTKEEYNHASIAFDKNLKKMYSFGRINVNNPLIGGFIRERINYGLFSKFPNTKCMILELSLEDSQFAKIKAQIQSFKRNRLKYHYNLLGILTIKLPFNINRENYFFCSQFVSYLLNTVGVQTPNLPTTTYPMDFTRLENIKVIYEGLLTNWKNPLSIPAISTSKICEI